MRIAGTAPGLRIDAGGLFRFGAEHGVQTWPVVLDLWPDPATSDAPVMVGPVEDTAAIDGLSSALHVLGAPDRTLEIRRFTASGSPPAIDRICLARNGAQHVLARRQGDDVEIRHVQVTAESDVGRHVAQLLSRDEPTSTRKVSPTLSAPTDELAERLAGVRGADGLVDALHALGAPVADAVALASALSRCHTRTEIVAISHNGVGGTQSSGAVAVFDSQRGRIVASPSRSPDGRVWTTLAPGGGHRIAQAVGLLMETLPEGRWMP